MSDLMQKHAPASLTYNHSPADLNFNMASNTNKWQRQPNHNYRRRQPLLNIAVLLGRPVYGPPPTLHDWTDILSCREVFDNSYTPIS